MPVTTLIPELVSSYKGNTLKEHLRVNEANWQIRKTYFSKGAFSKRRIVGADLILCGLRSSLNCQGTVGALHDCIS